MYHGDNAPGPCVLAVRTTKVAICSAGTTSDGMRSTALRLVQALGSFEMTRPRYETTLPWSCLRASAMCLGDGVHLAVELPV